MTTSNVDRANQANLLWPPVADAVDTYLKRAATGADAYERTWRLIHAWEAIVVTLAGAGVARLRAMPQHSVVLRRCREHLHGRTWDSVTRGFTYYQGALDGSALARLNILQELSTIDDPGSAFLTSLRDFLLAESLSPARLLQAWSRICDVPDVPNGAKLSVKEGLRLMNEFRNRIAHVPFPYDGLGEVAVAVEALTEDLFGIEPLPWKGFPDDRLESPLCGHLLWRDRVLYGSGHRQSEAGVTELRFLYPPGRKANGKTETWVASPFAHVDSMLRPYVLTRLRSPEGGRCEYTRYRAEASAVIYVENALALQGVHSPIEAEYETAQSEEERKEEQELVASVSKQQAGDGAAPASAPLPELEQALRYIRDEDYEPAIAYFSRLVATRPSYHIGWLRLGHAQRELAMRLRPSEPLQAVELFNQSIDALTHAAAHSYPDRKAQALYERSKAYYHRGRFTSSSEDCQHALDDAREAQRVFPGVAYVSWLAHIQVRPCTGAA